MATPSASNQSFQLSQPLLFDFIQRGSDANRQQHNDDSPAICSRTRSKASNSLPERPTNRVSRKQQKAEQKRKRKNKRSAQSNASRHLSGESNSSSDSNNTSPPSSPQSTRTFTQILEDALPTQTHDSPNSSSDSDSASVQEELNNYKVLVDNLTKANTALKCERDLLNDDLSSATKLLDRFKKNNKTLTTENDKLKRDQSRKSGLRKFTTSTISTQTETTPSHIQEATDISVAKFNSFCDQVTHIAQSLLDNFNDSKMPPPSTSSESFQTVPPRKRPAKPTAPQPTQGNLIPVIQAGISRTSSPPTYAQVVTSQNVRSSPRRAGQGARRRNRTIILGTSLTDGISTELTKLGVSSTTHIYRGGKLDLIRERVPHIFSKDAEKQPEKILLLAGGNDAEETSADMTMNEYEGLVRDIRKICPRSKIILSAIPPRKNNKVINDKITEVNDYLYDRGQRKDNVYFVDVVPKDSKLFTNKKVHFNDEGKSLFASNLKPFLMD